MIDSAANRQPPAAGFEPKASIIALAFLALTLIGVIVVSPLAMLVAVRDGAPALGICICAIGYGLWIVRALGLHKAPLRWQLLLSWALGLGALSLLMLLLGLCGVLHRGVWIGILIAGFVAGIARWKHLQNTSTVVPKDAEPAGAARLLWLFVVPFAVLVVLGATLPPGVLWPAEGNGYDVLEYHLGVPREFLDNGAISYLPHNIYSNFPFSVEMLYLLSMVLHGDALAGIYTAQLMNVALGMLFVAGVWLAGREFGRREGIIAGVTAATVPILTYMSVIAYVENGMLAFAALATAAMIRAFREQNAAVWRWYLAAGLCAGLSCGCKYTAIPMVVLPLLLATVWRAIKCGRRGFVHPLMFSAGALVAFAPWLVRNAVYTGNPVFPLARAVFHERDGIWNDERAAHWHDGHLPAPEDRPIGRRLGRLWHEVLGAGLITQTPNAGSGVPPRQELLGSALYGPVPLLAILGGLVHGLRRRKNRGDDAACRGVGVAWATIATVLIVWVGFTHLAGRFAIVLLLPVAILTGLVGGRMLDHARWRAPVILLLLGLVAWNYSTIHRIFTPQGLPYLSLDLQGRTGIMTGENAPHLAALNEHLQAGQRVLIVGDARRLYLEPGADYCVVFNRNPFAEAAERLSSDALIAWLREQGYAYVYVDWVEMARLRNSRYGFWPSITTDLFQSLVDHGLVVDSQFHTLGMKRPYGTLFRVPPAT